MALKIKFGLSSLRVKGESNQRKSRKCVVKGNSGFGYYELNVFHTVSVL